MANGNPDTMEDETHRNGRSASLVSLTSRGLIVPLNFTLGTSAAIVRTVPLLLIDLETEHGVTGHAEGARCTAEAFELCHLCEDRDVVEIDHAATFSLMENSFYIFPSNQ